MQNDLSDALPAYVIPQVSMSLVIKGAVCSVYTSRDGLQEKTFEMLVPKHDR